MATLAVVCVGVVAVAVIAGLAVHIFRLDAKSPPLVERKRFSGREMLMRKAKFGHRGSKARTPQPGAYRPKLLKFRKLKQLEQPSVRVGDIDFWAARNGLESRSEALRLLVGMAMNTTRRH